MSEFGIQLREKQKVRKSYSVLEKQFRNYFEKAEQRKGMTGENLLRMLEMRLDNVVFRMGLARSRAEARQLVNHGHFTVNGRPTNIPELRHQGRRPDRGPGEPPRARDTSRAPPRQIKAAQVPEWVSVDAAKLSGSILSEPAREQMPMEFNEQLVVEFYSR